MSRIMLLIVDQFVCFVFILPSFVIYSLLVFFTRLMTICALDCGFAVLLCFVLRFIFHLVVFNFVY